MATEDVTRCLSVPGRLAYAPTQGGLLTAFPHGGTALGAIADVAVQREEEFYIETAEEYGQDVGAVRGRERWALAFTLVQYDPDALALIYNTSTTSVAGYQSAKTVKESVIGAVTPLSPIVFSPYDTDQPAVLIYAPIPYTGNAAQKLDLVIDKGLEIAIVLLATRHSTIGRVISIDKLEQLNLSA